MNVVTCPDCGKKLRLTAELPPGKRIKCPGCATSFVPDENEEPEEPEPRIVKFVVMPHALKLARGA